MSSNEILPGEIAGIPRSDMAGRGDEHAFGIPPQISPIAGLPAAQRAVGEARFYQSATARRYRRPAVPLPTPLKP